MEPKRRINLLPPEVAEKRKVKEAWVWVTVGLVGVVVLLGFWTMMRKQQAGKVAKEANRLEAENRALQLRVDELAYLEDLQKTFDTQKDVVVSAWTSDISWVKVLREIATVMPEGVYLTSFRGKVGDTEQAPLQQEGGAKPGAKPKPGTQQKITDMNAKTPIGKIEVDAVGKSYREVGNWLYRVNRGMTGLSLAWVSTVQLEESSGTGTSQIVGFASDAYVTPHSWSWKGRSAARGGDGVLETLKLVGTAAR